MTCGDTIASARIIGAALAAVCIGSATTGCGGNAVEIPAPKPDAATMRLCAKLKMPDKVEGYARRDVTPKSPLTAAWGSPPIGLRCGVPLPRHDMLAPMVSINGVSWLPTPADRPTAYTAVGRVAYVQVTIPLWYADHGKIPGEILMDFNPAVEKAIPKKTDGSL